MSVAPSSQLPGQLGSADQFLHGYAMNPQIKALQMKGDAWTKAHLCGPVDNLAKKFPIPGLNNVCAFAVVFLIAGAITLYFGISGRR